MHIQVPCNKTKSCRKSTIYRWNHGFSTSDVREYCSRPLETDPIGKYHPSTILVPHFSASFWGCNFHFARCSWLWRTKCGLAKKKSCMFSPRKAGKTVGLKPEKWLQPTVYNILGYASNNMIFSKWEET